MIDIDPRRLVEPSLYKREGYPYAQWARLRSEAPVELIEIPGWPPFWAITRYREILEVARQPGQFSNVPRVALERDRGLSEAAEASRQTRGIVNMDPPEHAKYREVAAPWFTNAALERFEPLIVETARRLIDRLGTEGECDFVESVACQHPLHVVATILGVPESDEPFLLRLTQEFFNREDLADRDEDDTGRNRETFFEFFSYFSRLIEDRRTNPAGDFATTLANARIDGAPMGRMETLAYALLVATAGHETTRGSIAGGVLALLERPEALRFWAENRDVTPLASDEILRFTSPVTHMVRTAKADYDLQGRKIRAGDRLALFYASANRDGDVFPDPDELVLDRQPNRHLALGTGEHFCLGAPLARRMTGAVLEEFLTRVESLELAGTPVRASSNMIPSLTKLPIRYRLRR